MQVPTSDDLTLGIRAENFADNGLGLFSENESVFDITLSANYTIGNLTIIPEVRLDSFSDDVTYDNGTSIKSLSSFVLAAVYGF